MSPASATRISVIEKKYEIIVHVLHPCDNVLLRQNEAFPGKDILIAGFPLLPNFKTEETLLLG
jgi:hypothetical protein